MGDFQGKVAVVTGGASGIGRAMAERFAEEGMRIVIADIEQSALERAESEMVADGAEVLALRCDVSKAHDVKMLAEETIKAFDSVHVLCNNAGVGIAGRTWEIPLEDWEWVLGVNLWGVIHGLHYFVPLMLEHGQDAHIVNTASMAGLTSGRQMSPYYVSKHGVVTLSECAHHEFEEAGAKIGVSVLCPGWVSTNFTESDRNRPAGRVVTDELESSTQSFRERFDRLLQEEGLAPREVAEMVFRAIEEKTFYVLPHAHWKNMIHSRMENILEQRDPSIVMPSEM